jgi:polyphenol oxidase
MTDHASPGVLTAASLELPGIRHAYFTRQGGASSGIYASLNGGQGSNDAPEAVAENRARMAQHLGVSADNFVSAYQVHSADVAVVTVPWRREDRPKVDALVTNRPGIALGISTADCGPILFADAEAGVIGAAHAGWKGAISGVLNSTIVAMEQLGAKRSRIRVGLGMMISQGNYEVGAEFVAQFIAQNSSHGRFFGPAASADKAMFDLPAFITDRLRDAGIQSVEDLALCTYADEERFYSYRRTTHRKEADYGRHISAIVLEG